MYIYISKMNIEKKKLELIQHNSVQRVYKINQMSINTYIVTLLLIKIIEEIEFILY
jgi:hypothetical protein